MSRFGIGEGLSAPLYVNRPKGLGTQAESDRQAEWEQQLESLGMNLLADLAARPICAQQTETAGDTLKGIADRVVAKLGYGATHEAARCFFRLMEALAKKAGGDYEYAGYDNNVVNGSTNPLYDEGADFLTSSGRSGTVAGLIEYDSIADVINDNPCKVLRTQTKSIKYALALESQIDTQPVLEGKRYVFEQFLASELAGTQWSYGMDFLPTAPPPPPQGDGGGTPPPPPPQQEVPTVTAASKSPVLPVAIAAIGAYFLAKG